jgi:hypothetical protein
MWRARVRAPRRMHFGWKVGGGEGGLLQQARNDRPLAGLCE